VMYLPEEARYSYLLNLPEGKNIGKAVNNAMKAIELENDELKGVLPQTYTRFENDLLVALLKQFSNIPMDMEGDVFGKIYDISSASLPQVRQERRRVFHSNLNRQAHCGCYRAFSWKNI